MKNKKRQNPSARVDKNLSYAFSAIGSDQTLLAFYLQEKEHIGKKDLGFLSLISYLENEVLAYTYGEPCALSGSTQMEAYFQCRELSRYLYSKETDRVSKALALYYPSDPTFVRFAERFQGLKLEEAHANLSEKEKQLLEELIKKIFGLNRKGLCEFIYQSQLDDWCLEMKRSDESQIRKMLAYRIEETFYTGGYIILADREQKRFCAYRLSRDQYEELPAQEAKEIVQAAWRKKEALDLLDDYIAVDEQTLLG